jgi:hypothetical protein
MSMYAYLLGETEMTHSQTVTTILWMDQSQVEEEDDIGGWTPWRMAILNTDVKSNLTAYNS